MALTIVGPDAPLVAGVINAFRAAKMFGPTRVSAQLKGSKAFAKYFLKQHKISIVAYETFTEIAPAIVLILSSKAHLLWSRWMAWPLVKALFWLIWLPKPALLLKICWLAMLLVNPSVEW